MSWSVKELGTKLQNPNGKLAPTKIVTPFVALYFSAQWCGPCKAFTPILTQLYKAKHDQVTIIFVSLDNTEASFNSYHAHMPWPAIPFGEDVMRQNLIQKCSVTSVPQVTLLCGKTGLMVSQNVRRHVENDPASFPWGYNLVKSICRDIQSNQWHETVQVQWDRPVALYFSAGFSEPCLQMDSYIQSSFKSNDKCDLVLVGLDSDILAFTKYFSQQMPRHTYGISDKTKINMLRTLYNVNTIPALVTLDKDGEVIREDALQHCRYVPAEVPWYPKIVERVDVAGDALNRANCAILLLPQADKKNMQLMQMFELEASKRAPSDLQWYFGIGKGTSGIVPMLQKHILKSKKQSPCIILLPSRNVHFIQSSKQLLTILTGL